MPGTEKGMMEGAQAARLWGHWGALCKADQEEGGGPGTVGAGARESQLKGRPGCREAGRRGATTCWNKSTSTTGGWAGAEAKKMKEEPQGSRRRGGCILSCMERTVA